MFIFNTIIATTTLIHGKTRHDQTCHWIWTSQLWLHNYLTIVDMLGQTFETKLACGIFMLTIMELLQPPL